MEEIINPYWADLQKHVADDSLAITDKTYTVSPTGMRHRGILNRFEKVYSPTIADPDLVEQIAKVCGPTVVEVDAGTGYWSWLLAQYDKEVYPYDISPPSKYWPKQVHRLGHLRTDVIIHDRETLVCMRGADSYYSFSLALRHYRGDTFVVSGCHSPRDDKYTAPLLEGLWVEDGPPLRGLQRWRTPRVVHVYRRRGAPRWNTATRLDLRVVTGDA